MLGRRDFLRTAAAAPAIVSSSALGRDGHVAPSERIGFGFIGLGRMGSGHLRATLRNKGVRIAAVCDVQQAATERAKAAVDAAYGDSTCVAIKDFRELLARPDIDGVLVAAGERWHPIIAIEAARRGKHIYCEKPLSLSVAEAVAVRTAVDRAGVVFQFGTQQRSSFYYRQACELVRNGRVGALKTMMIGSVRGSNAPLPPEVPGPPPPGVDWDLWLGPSPWAPYSEQRISTHWLMISDYGLGCLDGAWGIHDIDIAQWVNDADATGPVEIEGAGTHYRDIRDAAYEFSVEHRYANGVTLIHMDMATARKRAPQFNTLPSGGASVFFGTEGWIYVSREGIRTHPEHLAREKMKPDGIHVIHSDDHRGNFFDAVRTGRRNISPVGVAVRGQTVAQQAHIAMMLGRKLRWDPAAERFIGDEEANRLLSRPMRSPWRI